jgi:hypothetical protein
MIEMARKCKGKSTYGFLTTIVTKDSANYFLPLLALSYTGKLGNVGVMIETGAFLPSELPNCIRRFILGV